MTYYVGEQYRIVAKGHEYGKTRRLTEDNVNSVTVLVQDPNGATIHDEVPMVWDTEDSLWAYKWDTTGRPPGTYHYRVTVIGADGKPSIEWGKVRLARQRATS